VILGFDLRRLDPARIGLAQLCDGPRSPTFEQYAHNALCERQIPGTGELPVADFVAALPPHVVIGLEVPLGSLAAEGCTPLERARRLMDATREVLAGM